jgi:ABC-2 type transport system permease protein
VTSDLKTVIWKERKLLFNQRGGKKQVVFTLLVPAAIFSILFPWQEGIGFFESPLPIFAAIFIPMLITGLTIPESFAGERERHTLETLLASRLSDSDILFGKLIISVILAWSITLISLFVGFIIANVTDWSGHLMFYTPLILAASLILSLLVAVFSSTTGVIISLRSSIVREAQQTLMATIMFPVLLLGVAGTVVFTIEGIREQITQIMDNINPFVLVLVVTIILIIACYFLMRAAMRRFQRARLILD